MTVFGVLVLAIISLLATATVKKYASSFALLTEVTAVLLIVISSLPKLRELFVSLRSVFSEADDFDGVLIMLKAFLILCVGAVTADVCRDNNETALATAVEIGVKTLSLLTVLPLFSAVIKVALSLLNGG